MKEQTTDFANGIRPPDEVVQPKPGAVSAGVGLTDSFHKWQASSHIRMVSGMVVNTTRRRRCRWRWVADQEPVVSSIVHQGLSNSLKRE